MPRALPAVTALTATLMLCACSESTGAPTAQVRTTSQSPSSTARPASAPAGAPVPALRVPGRVPGEISRTVLAPAHGGVQDTTTVWDRRDGDRNYVVKAACSATRTTPLTYVLLDARTSSASKSEAERTISSGTIPCDGRVIADSAGPLAHLPVTVTFLPLPEDLSQAYAVVVPE